MHAFYKLKKKRELNFMIYHFSTSFVDLLIYPLMYSSITISLLSDFFFFFSFLLFVVAFQGRAYGIWKFSG